MPTHRRQGTKASPRAPVRGGAWGGGTFLPKDTAINTVLFFECFYYFFCWGFIFFFSPPAPQKQDLHFLELYKIYTVRGGSVWPCRRGHSSPVFPLPTSPPRCLARPGAWHEAAPKVGVGGGGTRVQLGLFLQHQHTQLGRGGRERQGHTRDVLSRVAILFNYSF